MSYFFGSHHFTEITQLLVHNEKVHRTMQKQNPDNSNSNNTIKWTIGKIIAEKYRNRKGCKDTIEDRKDYTRKNQCSGQVETCRWKEHACRPVRILE